MIRVALAGSRGKVGQEMARALAAEADLEFVGGVDLGDDLARLLRDSGAQALVDFTHPSAALDNAFLGVQHGAAPVVGTTGIPPDGVDRLEAACRERGVGGIVAPNFAVGAVVMMWLAEKAAPYFAAAEVIELHHDQKADAPSGTALATARRLAASGKFSYRGADKVTLEHTRGGMEGNVGIQSVRLPGLVADQEVLFGLPGQSLTITHRTTSREAFVPGVLLAIRKVASGPGFYRALDQLLGLE